MDIEFQYPVQTSESLPDMTTAYVTHKRYTEHTLDSHYEFAGRIEAVWAQLQSAGLLDRMSCLTPSPVTNEQILRVHTQDRLNQLALLSLQNRTTMIDQDTYATPTSFEVARLSAGGVVESIDAIMTGGADNAIAAVRPPGHHATPDRSMGFCLLNNVAIGARYAQKNYDVRKVLIFDYDVHHGNGTQDIFYEDESVMFISIHQSPLYPGTGRIQEIGSSTGKGYTLNVPINGGYADNAYEAIVDQIVWKAVERFDPDLMLISAGFDAHWVDPLANARLSLSGYDMLARECIKMANQFCDGNIVFVMEGGYDLKALSHGWQNIAHALLGDDELSDPYGEAPSSLPLSNIYIEIDPVKALHGL
jgi:acetoin utilization deacetylase AcuC-like enzyme